MPRTTERFPGSGRLFASQAIDRGEAMNVPLRRTQRDMYRGMGKETGRRTTPARPSESRARE